MHACKARKCVLTIAPALAIWLGVPPPLYAQGLDEAKALKVKAAYLYNFAKFVHWPGDTLNSDSEGFVICVLGADPFGTILDKTVRGKTIAGHAVHVRRWNWEKNGVHDALAGCHVLFISESEQHRLKEVLAAIQGHPVLVVADMCDFARNGGMIGLVLEKGRIVFEINTETLERAKLKVSSKLLKLARIVRSKSRSG